METIKNITKEEFNKANVGDFTGSPKDIIINNICSLSELERFVYLVFLKNKNAKTNISFVTVKFISRLIYNKYNETTRKELLKIVHSLKNKGLISIKTKRVYNENSYHTTPISEYKVLNNNLEGSWDKIPNFLIISDNFTWKEKLFIIQIYHIIYGKSYKIKYSNNKISKMIGVSAPKVSKYISLLIEKGVFIKNNGGLEVNFFKLFDINNEVVGDILERVDYLRKENKRKDEEIKNKDKENKTLKEKISNLETELEKYQSLHEESPEDEINQPYLD